MRYIFEDSPNSALSKFYMMNVDSNHTDKFWFTNGNGGLYDAAEKWLKKYESEYIILFIDMVPGNKEITGIYKQLRALSRSKGLRLIIIPIVCFEYYLISSAYSTIDINDNHINIVLNKSEYWKCNEFIKYISEKSNSDILRKNSFENYCKWVLEFKVHKCMRIGKTADYENNSQYYKQDCVCDKYTCGIQTGLTLEEKSRLFTLRFPVISRYFGVLNLHEFSSIYEILDRHKSLIDEYNEWVIYCKKNSSFRSNYVTVDELQLNYNMSDIAVLY